MSFVALLAIAAAATGPARAQISANQIDLSGESETLSSDMTCTDFTVVNQGTLTVNQGVTLTLNCQEFDLKYSSAIHLHGTMTGSVGGDADWNGNSFINVYLSDGAKYTVSGLECMDGDDYLRYHGYDAATDGHGTVSVTNGSTAVTASSIGYKTTTYTFTATPASGYHFVSWTEGAGGEELGTDASIDVTCEQNGQYQVYANFEEDVQSGYSVTLVDTVDAAHWQGKVGDGSFQAFPLEGVDEGTTVTISYTGSRKVRSVEATVVPAGPAWNTVDLSTLTANYEAQDYDLLTGTLAGNYKISIADGATVTIDNVTINGTSSTIYLWAGITCQGDATIVLSGTNTVKGFYENYPGIRVPSGKTLTIQGDGSLNTSSKGWGAGIGGGYEIACGNIVIAGGTITATGGGYAAGIGGGYNGSCGDITITDGVTSVTATKGSYAPNSIGAGGGSIASCGTVTIDPGANVTQN